MKEHKKEMIAPIIITAIILLYYIFFFLVLVTSIPTLLLKIITGVVPLLLALTMIMVCVQRIKEIKEGETDELSIY